MVLNYFLGGVGYPQPHKKTFGAKPLEASRGKTASLGKSNIKIHGIVINAANLLIYEMFEVHNFLMFN